MTVPVKRAANLSLPGCLILQDLLSSFITCLYSNGRFCCSTCILEEPGMPVRYFSCLVVLGGNGIDSSVLGDMGKMRRLGN